MKNLALALLLVTALPLQAHAAAPCVGTVTNIYTHATGSVVVRSSWRNDWTQVCNVNEEWKGVPSQSCWAWFALLSAAVTDSKSVSINYPNLQPAECATMPTYASSPAPDFVRLIN